MGASFQGAEGLAFGGAVQVAISLHDVSNAQPSVVNGEVNDGDADVRVRVSMTSTEAGVLGARVAHESLHYQRVHLTVENLSTAEADRVLEVDLLPHVGLQGWSYGSHLKLPPQESTLNPLQSRYRFTVTTQPLPLLALNPDALPASALWRSGSASPVLTFEARPGEITSLPVTDVSGVTAYRLSALEVRTRLMGEDFVGARAAYVTGLQALLQLLEDPSAYPHVQGLTAGALESVHDHVLSALSLQDVGGDCGPDHPGECVALAHAHLRRAFLLAVMRQAAGGAADQDLALSSWNDAWAYGQELRDWAVGLEVDCLTGPPYAPHMLDCSMNGPLQDALLRGANAAAAGEQAGLVEEVDLVQRALTKIFYYAFVESLWRAVQGATDADVRRSEARAYFVALSHRLPLAVQNSATARLAERGTPSEDDAEQTVAAVNQGLQEVLSEDSIVDDTDMQEVLP
jgi:hypothetical protein